MRTASLLYLGGTLSESPGKSLNPQLPTAPLQATWPPLGDSLSWFRPRNRHGSHSSIAGLPSPFSLQMLQSRTAVMFPYTLFKACENTDLQHHSINNHEGSHLLNSFPRTNTLLNCWCALSLRSHCNLMWEILLLFAFYRWEKEARRFKSSAFGHAIRSVREARFVWCLGGLTSEPIPLKDSVLCLPRDLPKDILLLS